MGAMPPGLFNDLIILWTKANVPPDKAADID